MDFAAWQAFAAKAKGWAEQRRRDLKPFGTPGPLDAEDEAAWRMLIARMEQEAEQLAREGAELVGGGRASLHETRLSS